MGHHKNLYIIYMVFREYSSFEILMYNQVNNIQYVLCGDWRKILSTVGYEENY